MINIGSISDQLQGISIEYRDIGMGNAAMKNTVGIMIDTIKNSSKNYYVRLWGEELIRDFAGKGYDLRGLAILFNNLGYKVKYVKDPLGVEMLRNPVVVLAQIEQGITPALDCDCMTTLILSLARSLGYPTAIRVVATRPQGTWNHVYGLGLCQKPKKIWVPLDLTRPDKGFGWEFPKADKVYTQEVK